MAILETVEKHPYWTVGGVVGLILLFLVLRSSGGGTATSVDGSTDSSANALALQNAAVSGQVAQTQIAADVQNNGLAAALQKAAIDAGTSLSQIDAAKTVQLAYIDASSKVQSNHDTLAAQVAINNQDNAATIAASNNAVTINSVNAVTSALAASTLANSAVQITAINANKKQCGFLGSIFGC